MEEGLRRLFDPAKGRGGGGAVMRGVVVVCVGWVRGMCRWVGGCGGVGCCAGCGQGNYWGVVGCCG